MRTTTAPRPSRTARRLAAVGASLRLAMFFGVVAAAAGSLLGCSPSASPSGAAASPSPGAAQVAAAQEESPPIAGHRKGALRHHPISRMGSARRDHGNLRLVYGRLTAADHRELADAFREERLFEDVLEGLNESLVLPRDVEVRLEECGETNAFYDDESKSIQLCYELFEHFLEIFSGNAEEGSDEDGEEAISKAVAALVFTFYHELGHALIDVYDLPITGREEDAVDQLATVMLLETWEGEDSELAILSSAEWFDLDAAESEDEPDMADEHSLELQRYYNLVCWIYGSDTEYFADVADDWELPPARAQRCESEYRRMSSSWDALLGPHLQPVDDSG
jgi:hypothetical protein